jgi:hypothetical protein
MWRRVALVRIDVSEELSASIIRVTRIGELGTTLAVTSNQRTHAVFSTFPSLHPSSVQILSSAPYSQTHSYYISPLMLEAKFHTHTKLQATLQPCIFLFLQFSISDEKMEGSGPNGKLEFHLEQIRIASSHIRRRHSSH